MAKFNRHLPMSATIAIVVHVAVILLLVVGFQLKTDNKSNPLDNINTINATVINSKKLDTEKKIPPKENEQEKKLAEEKKLQDIKQKQEEEKKQLQAELEAEKKKAEEAQKKAEAEQQKAQKIKQQAEAEKQRVEEEARKQAEAEKKRLEEEVKKQAELEKKKAEEAQKLAEQKKAEEEKRKAEEAKKLAEEKKRKEEEAKKLAAEAKKRQEEEKLAAEQAAEKERLAKILAAEEAEINAAEAEAQRVAKARAMSKDIAIYQDALRSRIQSRWRKPLSEQPDAWCKVYVRQAPGGYVEDVVVEQCTGDEAFRRSVEEAVWKSDPLPEPPTPELFDRELRFKFIPEI